MVVINPNITNTNQINFFTDPEMEKFLNPIYGLYMCESGIVSNKFHLINSYPDVYIDTVYIRIKKICKEIPGTIQPLINIMMLTPIDIGRYIL